MGTFFRHVQLSRLRDLDSLGGLVSTAFWYVLHLLNDVVALQNFSKDNVLSVQPATAILSRGLIKLGVENCSLRGDGRGNEELGAIGILARVGHAEHASLGVLQLEVLIWKFVPVDGLPTSAVTIGEITTLNHE